MYVPEHACIPGAERAAQTTDKPPLQKPLDTTKLQATETLIESRLYMKVGFMYYCQLDRGGEMGTMGTMGTMDNYWKYLVELDLGGFLGKF